MIDGFNLFHKINAIVDSSTPRCDLIHYIRQNNLTGSRNNRVTIVFDGFETAELHTDPDYHIVFSEDRTADDVIKGMISSAPNKPNLVVVSDDREIRDWAKGEGAQVCRPHEFLAKKPSRTQKSHSDGYRGLSPSKMMDITEEMKKVWKK